MRASAITAVSQDMSLLIVPARGARKPSSATRAVAWDISKPTVPAFACQAEQGLQNVTIADVRVTSLVFVPELVQDSAEVVGSAQLSTAPPTGQSSASVARV
ncbi:hypothetical protein FRC08_002067 [Ceratobasidium sp. 394]|nr:hypothetical protein FRC08_002067 [Ceratobasidium sp. 394]